MNKTTREERLTQAFVLLADSLIDDYDMIDLLHTLVASCVSVLDVDAGGLVIADESGELELLASSSEQATFVEVMQLNAGAGPCVDCYRTGRPVIVADIEADGATWPEWQAAALGQGFRSMFATPMRVRGRIIGAMNLFSRHLGPPAAEDPAVAQALADVATISILQERVVREGHVLTDQLQRALDSRVLIEQAKGVLAAVAGLDMDEAFSALRTHARSHNMTLRDVAEKVANRSLDGFFAPVERQTSRPPV